MNRWMPACKKDSGTWHKALPLAFSKLLLILITWKKFEKNYVWNLADGREYDDRL